MATQTRNPTSDVSFTGTWTAAPRWSAVDDHPDSGNPIADGITHGTATAGEGLFGFSAFGIPAGSNGISIQVLYYDFKNGTQACNIRARLRCSDATGRDAPGGTHNPGNGNANIALRTDDYGANNPKTSAPWTVNDINGVGANALTAFGVVSTDASPSVVISSIRLQATYTPPVTGDGAATEAIDSAAASATVRWVAVVATTESQDLPAASATARWLATGAAIEASDVAAGDGNVSSSGIEGNGAATDASDIGVAAATVFWPAEVAATEAQDLCAAEGVAQWVAAAAALESPDIPEANGIARWFATAAAIETPDLVAGQGSVLIEGGAALSEPSDQAGSSGIVEWRGVGSSTEAFDIVAAAGGIVALGSAEAAESPDSASGDGTVELPPGDINGDGSFAGTPDLPAASGLVRWIAVIACEETHDAVGGAGLVQWIAEAAVIEQPDGLAASVLAEWIAAGAAIESVDVGHGGQWSVCSGYGNVFEPDDTATCDGESAVLILNVEQCVRFAVRPIRWTNVKVSIDSVAFKAGGTTKEFKA